MAKPFDTSKFPDPPKPAFPVEIVPPSSPSIGGGGSGFGQPDFKSAFLKFMQEAGEALGKAAAAEIEKVKLKIEGGERRPGEPLTGQNTRPQVSSELMALRQFLIAARMPGIARFAGIGGAGLAFGAAGMAVGAVLNAPNDAAHLAESQRRFAAVSPQVAGVFNESGVRGLQRDMVSGQNLAPSLRGMIRELDKFRDSFAQITDTTTEIKNVLETKILEGINAIVGPLVEGLFGKRTKIEGLPFLEKLQDIEREERVEKARKKAAAQGIPFVDRDRMAAGLDKDRAAGRLNQANIPPPPGPKP